MIGRDSLQRCGDSDGSLRDLKKKGTAKQILSRLVLFLLMIGMKQGRIDRLPRWHFFGPRSEIQSESAGNPRNDWEIVDDSVRRVKDEENIHPRRSGRILSGFSADSQRILCGFSADSLAFPSILVIIFNMTLS